MARPAADTTTHDNTKGLHPMNIAQDLSMHLLWQQCQGPAFWALWAIVREGPMTATQLVDWANHPDVHEYEAPLIDRTNVSEATKRAVACGVLTDQAGSYHATALGHRYIKWMNEQWHN